MASALCGMHCATPEKVCRWDLGWRIWGNRERFIGDLVVRGPVPFFFFVPSFAYFWQSIFSSISAA